MPRRPLLAVTLLALALRAASALVTEYKPIFPAYYYTDAESIRAAATRALAEVEDGREPAINGTLSERIQTLISLESFRLFGPRQLPVKLLNALLGALAVAVLGWTFSLVFAPEAAGLACLAVAVWPSHVFYTSQNLKEAPSDLLAYAAIGAAFAAGLDRSAPRARVSAFAAAAAAALLAAGFYRSYVLVCLAGALFLGLGAAACAAAPRANDIKAGAAVAGGFVFF